MKSALSRGSTATRSRIVQFRSKFQRSLRGCLQRGFSAEECFGIVWEETCERIDLPDECCSQLYAEMLVWAKQWVK